MLKLSGAEGDDVDAGSRIEKISVVIPARNEQETIGPVLAALNVATRSVAGCSFETIVVVDSLADGTVAVAQSLGARVLVNDRPRGKGSALYCGFRHAAGDAIVIFDADGSHNPADIGVFVGALRQGAGLVIGSRVLGGSHDHDVVRLFGNALFTVLFSFLFRTSLMDTLNGYKAFRREIVSGYVPRAHGFDVEIEIVARAISRGCRIEEVSTHENRRTGGRMKSRAVRDGFHILIACLREGARFRLSTVFGRGRSGAWSATPALARSDRSTA